MILNPVHLFKLNFSKNKELYKSFNNLLGFVPNRIHIYKQALTHQSYYQKGNSKRNDNERLEFLGDAVLDAIVGDILFKKFPFKGEGFLTEMRSKVVSRNNLSDLARKMGILQYIRYDKKNQKNKSFINQISGNALEAIFGAIYLDKGYRFTYRFFENRIFKLHIDIDHLEDEVISYKGKLFKWCQQNHKKLALPCEEMEMNGRNIYHVKVLVDNDVLGEQEHMSKKKAEELACNKACEALAI